METEALPGDEPVDDTEGMAVEVSFRGTMAMVMASMKVSVLATVGEWEWDWW